MNCPCSSNSISAACPIRSSNCTFFRWRSRAVADRNSLVSRSSTCSGSVNRRTSLCCQWTAMCSIPALETNCRRKEKQMFGLCAPRCQASFHRRSTWHTSRDRACPALVSHLGIICASTKSKKCTRRGSDSWRRKLSKRALTSAGGSSMPATVISESSTSWSRLTMVSWASGKAPRPSANKSAFCVEHRLSMAVWIKAWHLLVIFFIFYCIAELAIKPCRSSRSNTRGGFEKFHDTCKTGNKNMTKQTRKPKPKSPNTNTKEPRQVSLDGETGGEKRVKRPKRPKALICWTPRGSIRYPLSCSIRDDVDIP